MVREVDFTFIVGSCEASKPSCRPRPGLPGSVHRLALWESGWDGRGGQRGPLISCFYLLLLAGFSVISSDFAWKYLNCDLFSQKGQSFEGGMARRILPRVSSLCMCVSTCIGNKKKTKKNLPAEQYFLACHFCMPARAHHLANP